MTIWMDLTNSLVQHKGNVVGIIRVELLQAKLLHSIDPSIRFSVVTDFGFKEIKPNKLNWLFKSTNINDDYIEFQKRKKYPFSKYINKLRHFISRKIFFTKRHHRDKNILKQDFVLHPYKNGDMIYSCGWYGTNKERFFSIISKHLDNLKLVYTIYDLVMVKNNIRHFYTKYDQDINFENYINWISQNAFAVIYGGHTCQLDAEQYFKQHSLRIPKGYWIKFGGNITTKNTNDKNDKNVLQNLGITRPYILATGSFDAKKNYKVLYNAFCLLGLRKSQNIPQLIIVGRKLSQIELLSDMLNNSLTKDYIKILTCKDEELDILYKNCEFSVLPSLYEGYSLALPESLHYGKLCLCSDVPPLKEVGGDFAYYIHPNHPKEWADAIEYFVENNSKVQEWEDKIHKGWKDISWEESTKSLYNNLIQIQSEKTQISLSEENTDLDIKIDETQPIIYCDVSLLFFPCMTGIPRTQMLLARYLFTLRKNIKFFFISQGIYHEICNWQLSHLLSNQNLDTAVVEDVRSMKKITTMIELPFRKQDIVFSANAGYDDQSYDILIKTHNSVKFKFCQVIYDFTPVTVPHTHPAERVDPEYPKFLKNTYTLSDVIFYGGKTAQKDGEIYQKSLGLPIKNSVALKWGSDFTTNTVFDEQKDLVFEKYRIKKDYVLSVGTLQPRKNQEILYEAYLELLGRFSTNKEIPQIVICGHEGWKFKHIREVIQKDLRVKDEVIIITPNDEELNILYQNCLFTALPSFYEGWSLTLPESLNYGKFCLAADTPSLKEIGDNIIDYANPYDPVEWADKILYYSRNKEILKQKEKDIKEKWNNPTWLQCAQAINEVFNQLLEQKE